MMMMSSSALESIVPDSSQSASFHCYFGYFLVFMTSHNIGSTSSWSQSPFKNRKREMTARKQSYPSIYIVLRRRYYCFFQLNLAPPLCNQSCCIRAYTNTEYAIARVRALSDALAIAAACLSFCAGYVFYEHL